MTDFLATKDWKTVLDMKEHKSVRKTGVSDTLDEYASARKKDDLGRMVSALERIIEKAGEVKAAQSRFPKIVSHLEGTIKAARAEQQKLAPRLTQLAGKDEDEDNEDSTLGKGLARVRRLDEGNAWNFVLVPGKPASGLVVKRKALKKEDMETAFEMKGKRGPFFTGRVWGEGGRFVLDLGPEVRPVPGLAKAARNAALLHAEMNVKVLVRGMGAELDSDTDIEPLEEGGGTTGTAPEGNTGHLQAFEDRIGQVSQAILRFSQSPNAKTPGAADGLYGAIRLLQSQIAADEKMNDHVKARLTDRLKDLSLILDDATRPAPGPKPESRYPDEAYWQKLAEQIVRLDPDKRKDGWERYKARVLEVSNQLKADRDLVEPARTQVLNTLRRAVDIGRSEGGKANDLVEKTGGQDDPALARRFLAMERRYDLFIGTPGIDPAQAKRLTDAFTGLRDHFRRGEVTIDDPRLDRLDQILEQLAKAAFQKRQEAEKLKGQQEMHDALSQSMPLLKKAALPVGMVKDPEMIRDRVRTDADLRGLVEAMSGAAKAPGKDSAAAMEKAARKLVDAYARRRKDGDTPFDKADNDLEVMAVEALKRAQMMAMTAEYEALGAPPWDPAKADIASELQAQLFFLEGAIAQGKPTYEAPRLGGGDGAGASGSWWIERTEGNRGDGNAPGAKKKYIFKPGQIEAVAISGMPPGHGAPREVLGKRLDEMMSGAGFSVGVSPTTLARIDSSQLGEIDDERGAKKRTGPQLGSMQQLAPNNGPLAGKMTGPNGVGFMKSIDKRSFDDIAVFDMLFANLDRHGKNLLVATDPETGRNRLVPIDHGSSLPDPEMLQLNRRALLGGTNIFANPTLPQTAETLGPEALEALGRLDPDQMVRDMKRARSDIEGRHKEAEGTVTDEAIEAMGARARFIRLAARTVPVGELFQMLSVGAMRIAKARPEDLPDLIETLRAEARDLAEVAKAKDDTVDTLMACGDGSSEKSVATELTHLGWGWGLVGAALDDWIVANPRLVSRVLRGRIPNPAATREINRLTPLAAQIVPDIARQLTGKTLGDQVKLLLDTVNGPVLDGPPNDTPLDALKNEFGTLGGEAALKRAARVFPNEVMAVMPEPEAQDPEDLRFAWMDRVRVLRRWKAFEDKGGVGALVRIGATMPREMVITSAIQMLDEAELGADAIRDVLDLDEEEIDTRTANAYAAGLRSLTDATQRTRNESERVKLENQKAVIIRAWQDGKAMAAVTALTKYVRSAESWLQAEARFIDETNKAEEKIEQQFQDAGNVIQQALQPHMQRIRDGLARARQTIVSSDRGNAVNEFNARLEIEQKGADSKFRKMEAQVQTLEQRAQGHAGLPWAGAITGRIAPLRDYLAKFDTGTNLESGITYVGRDIDSLDKIRQALGNADIGNLPQPVTTILQDWTQRMANNSGMVNADSAAEEVRKALAHPVN